MTAPWLTVVILCGLGVAFLSGFALGAWYGSVTAQRRYLDNVTKLWASAQWPTNGGLP